MSANGPHNRRGFTLIELMVVVLLIAMIASAAAPRLLPALTMTEHENEARHLVGFGRAAIAHSAMVHAPIRVRINLDTQEYWAEVLPNYVETTGGTSSSNSTSYNEDDENWMPEGDQELSQATHQILKGDEVEQDYTSDEEQGKILDKQRDTMKDSFNSMAGNTLYARALRVKHDEGDFVREDSLFGRDRERDEDDEAMQPTPVNDPLLVTHRVLDSVFIDTVIVAGEEYKEGIVDIEISPLGLDSEVTFALFNEDEDLMIVIWDPMTATAWYKREI